MTKQDEFLMQCAFFDLVAQHSRTAYLPIYAVPNFAGHVGNERARIIAGSRAKRSGRRAGVPDICVDVARDEWHGLRLELKTKTGRVAPEQKVWHEMLRMQGYRVEVCRSSLAAWETLLQYLGIAP